MTGVEVPQIADLDDDARDIRREAEVSSDIFVADVMWAYAHLDNDDVTADTSPRLSAWTVWNWARNPKNVDKFLTTMMPKALSIQEARASRQVATQEQVDPEVEIAEVAKILRQYAPTKPDVYAAIRVLRAALAKPKREQIVAALKALGTHVANDNSVVSSTPNLFKPEVTVGLLPPTPRP